MTTAKDNPNAGAAGDFAAPVKVSVIVPCRNERAYLENFLASMLRQERDGLEVEFLIADGMSDDGTREILQQYATRHPELRVIENPGKFVSTGLNAAIRAARGDIIARMDVHTEYAPDYLRQCVRVLGESGAGNVGGPARTRSRGHQQAAVCLAYHSPFSCGGAAFHNTAYEGPADTVTYGCWQKSTLEKLGGFDEELIRNQDDELNLRLSRAGGKIWQSTAIQSWYYPRASWGAVFRQYMQYGYWKVRVIQKHQLPASIRHLVPGGFVGSLIALAALAPFSRLASGTLVGLAGIYLTANLLASLWTCRTPGTRRYLPRLPGIFMAYHFGYGYGFLRGLIDFGLRHKSGSQTFTHLTRDRKV